MWVRDLWGLALGPGTGALRGPPPSEEQEGSSAWYSPWSAETQDGPERAPGVGVGRATPDVYKPHIPVTVTVLRKLQVGKGASDGGTGNPGDCGRNDSELRGQRNGIWLWQARENFPEEVAFKLALEK